MSIKQSAKYSTNTASLPITREENIHILEPMVQEYFKLLDFEKFLTLFQNFISSQSVLGIKRSWLKFFDHIFSVRLEDSPSLITYINFLIFVQILEYHYFPERLINVKVHEDAKILEHLAFSFRFTNSELLKILDQTRVFWTELYEEIRSLLNFSVDQYRKPGFLPGSIVEIFSFLKEKEDIEENIYLLLNHWSPLTYRYIFELPVEVVQRILIEFFRSGNKLEDLFLEPIEKIKFFNIIDQMNCFSSINNPSSQVIDDEDLLGYIINDDSIIGKDTPQDLLMCSSIMPHPDLRMCPLMNVGYFMIEIPALELVYRVELPSIYYNSEDKNIFFSSLKFKIISYFEQKPEKQELSVVVQLHKYNKGSVQIFNFLVRKFTKNRLIV